MLPLIAGIGSKLLSPGKTDDKNLAASKKKIKTEKFFDKKDKSGALVKTSDDQVKIKPSSALVKYQPPETSKDKISDLSLSERKKSTGDDLQNIIDEVKKLRSGLVKVRGLLAERKNTDLKSLVESRKALQIEKKKRREDELENRKPKEKKDGISLPKPKFSFFDSIVNFFTNILIGSLLNFLLANKNTIFKAFDDITKGFNNIFNVMRYAIISISTTMPKLVKSLASFSAKIFKGPAKFTGSLLSKLGGTIKNLLVRTGKALGNFVSGTFKNLRGLAGGAGTSITRATGVQQRRLTGAAAKPDAKPGAKPQLKQLPKPGVPRQTSPTTLQNAQKKLLKPDGVKHFKKVSGVFKKIPFIGALIGIGIDLAMGERLDNAIAGAAGASLGAAIGGAIGTAALPIPFVGTFLGGTIGAAVGDWAGKEIYKNLSGQITQINPPVEESGFSDKLQRRLDSPLPPDFLPTGSVSGGNADFWTLAAIASLESGNPQGQADVAQSIYNRLASRKYSGNSIKELINARNQYSPVGESKDPSLWSQIVDESTAIKAVSSHPRGKTNPTMMVSNAALNILNPNLRKEAAAWVGGRTDFAQPGAAQKYPGGFGYKERHGHLFGWYVGPGSIAYGKTNPGPAQVSSLGGAVAPVAPPAPVLPGPDGRMPVQGSPSTPLIGGGNATFGSTGRVSNAPNWVHGHFQDNNRNALLNNTFPIVKRLLEQGVPVVITGGPGEEQLSRNMSDSRIRAAISRGIDRHSNRTRGYFAVDVSVPEGTKVPIPLQDIRSGGNEGISGLIPGTNTFIGHLAPGSRSATSAELSQALRQQASYDQRGGTIVVPAPIISGGSGQMMPSGGGGVLPVGMLQKDVLNSYYRAQLMGFLYKQG